ncbi:uncharacterized protein [Periplaneta americana]|uniref:uncharacterized protein isoform X2 n=1 Tax=Periplaneta americana TaxID=6978 RepID=UPI0037E719DB
MECVAGFWSSRVEEGDAPSWSSSSFRPDTSQSQQQQKQSGAKEYPDSKSPPVLSPNFTRGSYRRYMNHLIRSNFSEKLQINFPTKPGNIFSRGNKVRSRRDDVCCTRSSQTSSTTGRKLNYLHNGYSSKLYDMDSPARKQPVTTVPGGDRTNYVLSNRNVNSRDSRFKSLASLSPRAVSGMRGPALPTTNGIGTDGGVVVGNKGDAPSPAPFYSYKHPPSTTRDGTHQSDAEVEETWCSLEKYNAKEITKGRQRKTGAFAITPSRSVKERNDFTVPEQEVAATHTSTALRFPCVEKLIHKYTAMIEEQRERVLAERQNQSRRKQRDMEDNPQQCEASNLSAVSWSSSSDLSGRLSQLPLQNVSVDTAEQATKDRQQCRNVGKEQSTSQCVLYGEHIRSIAKPHREDDDVVFTAKHPLTCGAIKQSEACLQHAVARDCATEQSEGPDRHSGDFSLNREQCNVEFKPSEGREETDSDMTHPMGRCELKVSEVDCSDGIVHSQHSQPLNDIVMNAQKEEKGCKVSKKEGAKETDDDGLLNPVESTTSLFIKASPHVEPNIGHVGGITTASTGAQDAGDEGRHTLQLPRAPQRSVSPAISSSASDEGCSVIPPPESSLTPCSSEDDIKKLADRAGPKSSTSRWTWPHVNNDQDNEVQARLQRHEYGRCGSSDSAVCLLPSDDERRMQMRESDRRQPSTDSDIDFMNSAGPASCDKAMLLDRYANKSTTVFSFDVENLQKYFWKDGLSPKETRRDSDVFPESADVGVPRGDIFFEEMRHTKETVCDDVCDSGIDRDTFLTSAGDSCWDISSVDVKTDEGETYSVDDDRNQFRSSIGSFDDGYPYRHRRRQFRKLTSMLSCESGVVEDEDCSRKSSTAEPGENTDNDEYLVDLRRQSTQSFQTDDDESGSNSQYRYWRTPSVVVSDYSDDVPYFTSVTLEELEQLRIENSSHQRKEVSSSECGSAASSVSGSVSASALDTDYALRTPERKASDCSTCSTLSGDEDASCDALLQPVRTKPKVTLYVLKTFGKRDKFLPLTENE